MLFNIIYSIEKIIIIQTLNTDLSIFMVTSDRSLTLSGSDGRL